jgi:hypothetical protein
VFPAVAAGTLILMAVIPPDAGISLRLQTETNLQPVAPVKPVGGDLPALQTGQAFTARILEVLPENSYRALVAGKELTLSLPQGAAAGDTLDLVVIDRTPKVIVAQTAPAPTSASAPAAENAVLSAAGRLIANLMQSQGDAAAPPAQLARGQPVLPQPPADAAQLASQLSKAVSQSGLFYESHQAQWIAGKLPLQQLLQEPQGQQPPLPAAPAPEQNQSGRTTARPPDAATGASTNTAETTYRVGTGAGAPADKAAAAERGANVPPAQTATARVEPSAARVDQTTSSPAQAVADNVRPLVQQQLDAVATQRLAWHGEVWPGQTMDWQVQWENPPSRQGEEAESPTAWSTTLSLTTPHLGRIDATLQLVGGGVRIALQAPAGGSAADLLKEAPALASALSAAGVPMVAFQVRNETT